MWPFQRNQLTSDNVERADTVKKNQDERNVWLPNRKSMMSFVSITVDQSPIALGSIASRSLGTIKAESSNLDLTSTE